MLLSTALSLELMNSKTKTRKDRTDVISDKCISVSEFMITIYWYINQWTEQVKKVKTR